MDRSTDSGRHNTFSSVNIHNDTADSGTDNDNRVFVSEKELDRYRYYHPYWKKRGIVSEDIIERFDLGYDSATHCITMPVRDYNGKVIFVARRSVKTKFFNYPDSVHKPLYGLYEILQSMEQLKITRVERIFVCESMIDALLLWQSGYYAVAMNGLGSASQIEDLKKLPTRNIVLCTDNDEAGEKARKVLRDALNVKLITEIKFPPDRKDVGECTKEEITNISNWEIL